MADAGSFTFYYAFIVLRISRSTRINLIMFPSILYALAVLSVARLSLAQLYPRRPDTDGVKPEGPALGLNKRQSTWMLLGCLTSSHSNSTVLSDNQTTAENMTTEKCQNSCKAYDFAAVYRGNSCACGDKLSYFMHGICDTACAGDQTETCGGAGNFADVYRNPSFSSGATSPWVPIGCFNDGFSTRLLSYNALDSNMMSVDQC